MRNAQQPNLPFAQLPKTLRRLSRPERRAVHRVITGIIDGELALPRGFLSGSDLTNLYAAADKIEPRRRRREDA